MKPGVQLLEPVVDGNRNVGCTEQRSHLPMYISSLAFHRSLQAMRSATWKSFIPSWFLLVAMIAMSSSPARALIVENTAGTTVAPADDPGWNFVTGQGSRNFVYLGNGWVLSAFHVGVPTASELLHFPGGSFNVIPNQAFIVKNPVGQGLSTDTDLRMFRINGDVGTPSFSIGSQQIFESTPEAQREVVFIGPGPSRQEPQFNWNVQVVAGTKNDIWTEVETGGTYHGYKAVQTDDDVKRWGKNQIADEEQLVGGNDNDLRFPLQLQLGVGLRDIMSMVTKFDAPGQGGITNEAQVVSGDSGTAIFFNRNGQWELIGIVNALYSTFENQPGPLSNPPSTSTAIYGNYTTFADLSYYNQAYSGSISDIMNTHPYNAVLGDINFDGVVSGTTTNGVPTGDIAAFVAGWGYNNGTGVGTYGSWLKGDLSQDGKTDAADFLLLRGVLNPAGAGGLTLESLLSGVGVPEPTSLCLALAGAGFFACSRRRRR